MSTKSDEKEEEESLTFRGILRRLNTVETFGPNIEDSSAQLLSFAKSAQIRDFDWNLQSDSIDLYGGLWNSLHCVWCLVESAMAERAARVELQLLEVWHYVSTLPEFDCSLARDRLQALSSFPSLIIKRIVEVYTQECADSANMVVVNRMASLLKLLAHWTYRHCAGFRAKLRLSIGNMIIASHRQGTNSAAFKSLNPTNDAGKSRNHVKPLLELLRCIVEGLTIETEMKVEHALMQQILLTHLMTNLLVPLHLPNEMVEWRDQIPVIQVYHEALISCMSSVGSKGVELSKHLNETKNSVLVAGLAMILHTWPDSFQTNTPKQVLLLHELEKLLTYASTADFLVLSDALLSRIVKCIGSEADNIRPAQRALQFFKNKAFLKLLCLGKTEALSTANMDTREAIIADKVLLAILPALYRGGVLSWNPTVNKMTALALTNLKAENPILFTFYADKSIGSQPSSSYSVTGKRHANENKMIPPKLPQSSSGIGKSSQSTAENNAVLSGNRPMLPPSRALPPLPAAKPIPLVKLSTRSNLEVQSKWSKYSATNPPPIEVTGVAPWAMQKTAIRKSVFQENIAEIESSNREGVQSGSEKLDDYITRCMPTEVNGGDVIADWNDKQAALSPILLPQLKFHDLVFGKTLGIGAFSEVKYVRVITTDRTQSQWPEYAVKIISAAKIEEYKYTKAVEREMATLQLLSHPGIARLISTFKYTNSYYMVLEYASRGDLHTFLLQSGKLSHLQTRFVIGEVCSALHSVHENGFSFNDLKPENILITEIGHIKLTDFGACRPMSEESQAQLDSSFMSLKNIRDGDWRLRRTEKEEGNRAKIDYGDSQNENFVDDRLEGTPAYLPPEVLQRITRIRDNLRDSWALGCVAHFCLEGRPRYFGSTDEVLQQIKFETEIENADGSKGSTHLVHFADSGEDTDDARTLVLENLAYHNFISGLNNFNPLDRLRISQALFHDYLSKGILTEADSAGIDFPVVLNPTTLHQSPPIALPQPRKRARTSELGDDQLWARRQFSVLWSPMPDDLKPEENVEADKKKGLTECHASDIWLSSHPHLMIPIKESAEEFGSAFLAPNHR